MNIASTIECTRNLWQDDNDSTDGTGKATHGFAEVVNVAVLGTLANRCHRRA